MTFLELKAEIRFGELDLPDKTRKALRGKAYDEFLKDSFFKKGHVLICFDGKMFLWPTNPTLERLLSYGTKT